MNPRIETFLPSRDRTLPRRGRRGYGTNRPPDPLRDNLGAVGFKLTPDQMAKLDAASAVTAAYPYFPYRRQEGFARLKPPAA
jgi:hypothetical protein